MIPIILCDGCYGWRICVCPENGFLRIEATKLARRIN